MNTNVAGVLCLTLIKRRGSRPPGALFLASPGDSCRSVIHAKQKRREDFSSRRWFLLGASFLWRQFVASKLDLAAVLQIVPTGCACVIVFAPAKRRQAGPQVARSRWCYLSHILHCYRAFVVGEELGETSGESLVWITRRRPAPGCRCFMGKTGELI